jgi:hypothetical protein
VPTSLRQADIFSDLTHSESRAGEFIQALGEPAHIFAATKETFDDVSFTIKPPIEGFLDALQLSGRE